MSEWNDASVPEKLEVLRQQILAVDRAVNLAQSQISQQLSEILRMLTEMKTKPPG